MQDKEIQKAEKILTVNTRLPAEAAAYKTKVEAEGRRFLKLKEAEGEAKKIRLIGAANAAAYEAVCWKNMC